MKGLCSVVLAIPCIEVFCENSWRTWLQENFGLFSLASRAFSSCMTISLRPATSCKCSSLPSLLLACWPSMLSGYMGKSAVDTGLYKYDLVSFPTSWSLTLLPESLFPLGVLWHHILNDDDVLYFSMVLLWGGTTSHHRNACHHCGHQLCSHNIYSMGQITPNITVFVITHSILVPADCHTLIIISEKKLFIAVLSSAALLYMESVNLQWKGLYDKP